MCDMCDKTYSHMWHVQFTCVTWHTPPLPTFNYCSCSAHTRQMIDARVKWLIHLCDMTHSHVWRDQFTRVTWPIHMWDMSTSHIWRGTHLEWFTCVTWQIHMWDITHSHVWHDRLTCGTSHIHMCDMTDSHVGHHTFTCVTWDKPRVPIFNRCSCWPLMRQMTDSRVTWLIWGGYGQ